MLGTRSGIRAHNESLQVRLAELVVLVYSSVHIGLVADEGGPRPCRACTASAPVFWGSCLIRLVTSVTCDMTSKSPCGLCDTSFMLPRTEAELLTVWPEFLSRGTLPLWQRDRLGYAAISLCRGMRVMRKRLIGTIIMEPPTSPRPRFKTRTGTSFAF